MLYSLKFLRHVTTQQGMNICFFMHFIYIVPEDWNAEGTLHFKMKMSEQGCLNTGLLVEDGSLIFHCSQWRCRVKNLGATQKGLPGDIWDSLMCSWHMGVAGLWETHAFVGGQVGKSSTRADDTRQLSVGGWTELPVSSDPSGSLDT